MMYLINGEIMRILLLFVFIFNFNLIGEESENSYKYEPEGNKAVYFFW